MFNGAGLRFMVNMAPPGQGHPGGPRGGACRWTFFPRSQATSALGKQLLYAVPGTEMFLQAALARVVYILFWKEFQIM